MIPENIPDYRNQELIKDGVMNFLIAGKNEGMVDTMILASMNVNEKSIKMVSIPRDLFINNRKINSIYGAYGMEELKRTLAKVTGYKINRFVLIDMYAFVEVIDLIGGIDVVLNEAVVDPSYKVLENGEWGTLFYRPGEHHLSGKQALRLARTRHTSSDFARSERQQMILKSLLSKVKDGVFGDAGKLTELLGILITKVETDLNLADAVAFFFRYRGFEIKNTGVLSTGNVLISKYENEQKIKDCRQKIEELKKAGEALVEENKCSELEKGAYILLPKEGNWNLIKWFVRGVLE